jgi:hypothetical protein
MNSTISPWASSRRVRIVLSVAIIVAVVFAGLFGYAYLVYSNDIAVKIHGMVTVANNYGSPYIVDLYTNVPQLPFHAESVTPVVPLFNNSTAYYSAIVISGHEYDIGVLVSALGKGAPDNCYIAPHSVPGCTSCQAPSVKIPFATIDYSYNITVSC